MINLINHLNYKRIQWFSWNQIIILNIYKFSLKKCPSLIYYLSFKSECHLSSYTSHNHTKAKNTYNLKYGFWWLRLISFLFKIEQKGMTFDHDFMLFVLLFFFPLFRREEKKGKRITKVVVKSHAFLFDLFLMYLLIKLIKDIGNTWKMYIFSSIKTYIYALQMLR